MARRRFRPSRTIAVDVDGTLTHRGAKNVRLIAWLREQKAKGFKLLLWSAQGQAHAQRAADAYGIATLFDTITGKPGYIVDDKGWGWIRGTRVLRVGQTIGEEAGETETESGSAPQ